MSLLGLLLVAADVIAAAGLLTVRRLHAAHGAGPILARVDTATAGQPPSMECEGLALRTAQAAAAAAAGCQAWLLGCCRLLPPAAAGFAPSGSVAGGWRLAAAGAASLMPSRFKAVAAMVWFAVAQHIQGAMVDHCRARQAGQALPAAAAAGGKHNVLQAISNQVICVVAMGHLMTGATVQARQHQRGREMHCAAGNCS